MVNIKINDTLFSVNSGETVLEACRSNGIFIPSLCSMDGFQHDALCRVCVVEDAITGKLYPACATLVYDGLSILTNSSKVINSRRKSVELMCESHRMDCEYCEKYFDCGFHDVVSQVGIDDRIYAKKHMEPDIELSSPAFIKDNSKCILCRRCELACEKQGVYVIGALKRGNKTQIGSVVAISESDCVHCGQCLAVCPTGALSIKDDSDGVWDALRVSPKRVIAIVDAPVAENIGEYMHYNAQAEGKLAAFLRKIGFDCVYSTNIGRRAVIEKEMNVFSEGKSVISSKCPTAAAFCKKFFPELEYMISPYNNIFEEAAFLAKQDAAKNLSIKETDIQVILISGCTYSKLIIGNDIDISITTREMLKIMHHACLSRFTELKVWKELEPEEYDNILPIAQTCVNSVSASGLDEVRRLLQECTEGAYKNNYIEISACPGGCANGGCIIRARP